MNHPQIYTVTDSILAQTRALAAQRAHMYIYVIGREEGPVKVGITSNLKGRLCQIQTGCYFKAEILHAEPMLDRSHALHHEAAFHDVYAEKRLVGEWFDLEADLAIELIETGLEHEAYFHARGVLENE